MTKRLLGQATSIGIDLGERCIKAVQLASSRSGWKVMAAAVLDRLADGQPTRQEIQRLADVLYRQGFTAGPVTLAAPHAALHAEILELPPRGSQAPLEQIARLELARTGKFEPEGFAMALWDLPAPARDMGATHAMGVAVRHAEADALVELFEEQGLHVRGLDCQAWAILRACAGQAGGGVTAMLDIGWNRGLLVLAHQRTVVYQRTILEAAQSTLHQEIAEHLGLDGEACDYLVQALGLSGRPGEGQADPGHLRTVQRIMARRLDTVAAELEASFSYAGHRYPDVAVEQLLLVGGGAAVPGVAEQFSARLKIPARTVCPAQIASCPPDLLERCRTPLLTAALGLAQETEL